MGRAGAQAPAPSRRPRPTPAYIDPADAPCELKRLAAEGRQTIATLPGAHDRLDGVTP